ncbi:MAG: hypothetical protein QG628_169 [Patescibacteria group bacterium]|nr:hypothetical protein [Patescibacteria group bacterium]
MYISNSQKQELHRSRKKRVVFSAAFIFVFISVALLLLGTTQAKNNTPPSAATDNSALSVRAQTTKSPTDAGGTQAKTVSNTVSKPVPKCTTLTTYAQPNAPSSSSLASGLNQLPTQTVTYDIYGNSVEQISAQIYSCSPVSHAGTRYAASTDYSINWSFKYQGDDSGVCKISSAYVGLHIIKVMPAWQPTGANSRLKNSWVTFFNNLDQHENGHTNLDRQYAERILSELQNLSPTTCDAINTVANARANALISELNRANDQYDASTDHGHLEGAHL